LINQEVIEALGPNGTLINVARGSVVDEAALVSALQAGKLGAAGLDVFEVEPCAPKELIAMDNVVLLPHVASASHHTRMLMGNLVADNVISWMKGKGPLTPVAETPYKRGK
ncbi:MAG: 2-hydroxyacid dehydrogenase, partial [Beijerinckiaceae bacterium]|nr:2-hydroxyacid dehydrogenase [Beijerinckiaceae bacterium]